MSPRCFDDPVPALTYTYSGFVGTATRIRLHSAIVTTATQTSPVGMYPITQGTLSAGSNYTIAFTPGTLEVIARGAVVSLHRPDRMGHLGHELDHGQGHPHGQRPRRDRPRPYRRHC